MNVTFRNNFVHHNVGDGIWYDFNNNAGRDSSKATASRITDATGLSSRSASAPPSGTTPSGAMREDGVLISVSQNAQIYNNLLEANFGGIEYFLNCGSLRRGVRSPEQCGVRQHDRRRHAELHVRERLQPPLPVHLSTAGAVSEWRQEPHLLPQHVPCAVTLFYSVFSLGRLEGLESVAGTGVHDGHRRDHCRMSAAAYIPVAAEAGAL